MRLRLGIGIVFVGLGSGPTSTAAAQIALRQARVEVITPQAPTPVTVDTQRVLVYELHVTNFGTGSLALRQLDIIGGGGHAAPLARYQDSALRRMVAPAAGNMTDTGGMRLDPGFRSVVFVWLPIPTGHPMPTALRHRLVFAILDSAMRRGTAGPGR